MKIGSNLSSTTINGMQSNAAKKLTQSRNTPFNGAIQSASFYYLDKFALLVINYLLFIIFFEDIL